MREDRRAKQLDRLEEAQHRSRERLEAQQARLAMRFARARQRIMDDRIEPSDDQQRIIAAALELLDEVGLNELSLRKLATKLDLKAPALYWYFKSKGTLIDYMAEAILQSEFKNITPRAGDTPWQDWLVNVCQRLRKAMHSRRDGARIVAGAHLFPAVTLLKVFEATQESLISDGVDPRQADLIATTAIHLTFGRVIEEQSSPGPEDISKTDLAWIRREFPRISKSIKRTLEDNKHGYDEFEASLRLFIGYAGKDAR
jgi:TetR/AcrR family transcriptional regulator, tetracycline repressor protein